MEDVLININGENVQTLEILFLLTILSLLPSILVMTTSFTRILIVISFLRNAMGMQQSPPNTVLVGMALFLTIFIMSPVLTTINETAYVPYKNEEINQAEAISLATNEIKNFMFTQTEPEILNTFIGFADIERPETLEDVPFYVATPAFMASEMKRGFIMGFYIFIPFLLVDIIVASTLMSMGMMMLPPAMISLPFKILLFVILDGWMLLFETLIISFE